MSKNYNTLPIAFIAVSSFISVLAFYLLTTKTNLHPQLFIEACGEVLKKVKEHAHLNPDGVLSALIILTTVIGVSLAIVQLLKFAISHRKLSYKIRREKKLPKELSKVVRRLDLQGISISVVDGKPTAYTIGLFSPQIVVSLSLVQKASSQQLEAVILHEIYHIKNHHLLWLLISRLVGSLFFFVPLIEHMAQQLKIEFEVSADSFVVSKQKTRDHLCSSLALNLQYAGGVIPHFATSPIEKRVESLIDNKFSFEWISASRLVISFLSLSLMVGLAFIQPNQIAAEFSLETGGVCQVGEKCKTTDCSNFEYKDIHNFTPVVPASFSISSSY